MARLLLLAPAPAVARKIDASVASEAHAFGLEQAALQARMLAVRGDAALSVHHALPGDALARGADRPSHANRSQAALDQLGQLPVSRDLAARNAAHQPLHALERRRL